MDNNEIDNPLLSSDTSNNIVDGGIGVFPPEDGALEAGAKYLELPVIEDEDEKNLLKSKLDKKNNKLGLFDGLDLTQLGTSDAKSNEWKSVIGFPTTWASTEYLKGREWLVLHSLLLTH